MTFDEYAQKHLGGAGLSFNGIGLVRMGWNARGRFGSDSEKPNNSDHVAHVSNMAASDSRAEFEKQFPVPKGVYWNEISEQYDGLPGVVGLDEVEVYHGQWMGWQAASAQLPEMKRIALRKIDDIGGKPAGLLVKNEAGKYAAVDVHGRVQWLDWGDGAQGAEPVAESVASAVRELLKGFYACTRVWEAWSTGTMTEDDFEPAEETELADDIARTVLKIYTLFDELKASRAQREIKVPNEHGKNRYGLDMAYFRNLFNRELNRPLVDFMPVELARVLARASRTADASVLQEPEFQTSLAQGAEPQWAQKLNSCLYHNDDYKACATCSGRVPCVVGGAEPVTDKVFAEEFRQWWHDRGQFVRSGGGDYERTFAFEAWRHLYPRTLTQPQRAVIDWPAIHKMADEYVEGYEFRGDDGDYHPKDEERFLIQDAVLGLMVEIEDAIKLRPQSAGVPDGWRLVPIEPTETMMRDAAYSLCDQFGVDFVQPKEQFARAVYRELLRFAPQPTAGQEG